MSEKNTDKITEWGQIKLVCPCGGLPELKYHFEIVTARKLTFYKCVNPSCPNSFSTDYHLKIMQWLNTYYEKNGTIDGFVHYFTARDCNMRAKYIETQHIADDFDIYVIEVGNMTRQKMI